MQELQELRVPSQGWEELLQEEWHPTPAFLPEKFCGQRNLVDYCPWGHKDSDMTEQLSMAHSTSC